MEFQTKIVVGNKNPRAWIAWAGGILLFLAMILMCVGGYQRYGFWLFGVSVVVLVVGAILAKGDVGVMDLSDIDLVLGPELIRIGETVYPLGELSKLVLQVEGYDGMDDPNGYAPGSYSGRRGRVNGMNNYVDFRIGEEKVEWQFYLQDALHVQQLGALLKEWYSRQVAFEERSGAGDRTFLFEPVTEEELKDRMIENGYM